jgi:hypothetical protein
MLTFVTSERENGVIKFSPSLQIAQGGLIAIGSVVLAIVIALYVLRAIGVYVLAKRQNVEHAWLAWLPFTWVYMVCKITGKVRLFGCALSKLALPFTIIYGVITSVMLTQFVLTYYPLIGGVVFGGKRIEVLLDVETWNKFLQDNSSMLEPYRYNTIFPVFHHKGDFDAFYPSYHSLYAIRTTLNVFQYMSLVFELAHMIIFINLYIALFRKFYPQHFILATILSMIGFFGPFVFAIRNRKAINYAEYMRARYNMYGNPYANPYGNPYGNQGGVEPNEKTQTPPEHPFSEFAERGETDPGDPFAEFSSKEKEPFTEFDEKDKDKK